MQTFWHFMTIHWSTSRIISLMTLTTIYLNLVEINQVKNENVKMLLIHNHPVSFTNQTIMTKNQNMKCKQIRLHSIEWPANQIKCSANNVRSTLLFDRHTYSYQVYIHISMDICSDGEQTVTPLILLLMLLLLCQCLYLCCCFRFSAYY